MKQRIPKRGPGRHIRRKKRVKRRRWRLFSGWGFPWKRASKEVEGGNSRMQEGDHQPPKRSRLAVWRRRLWTTVKWCSLFGLVFSTVGGVLLYQAYQEHIVENPGQHIGYDHIQAIIFQESPVYFVDGETPVGVLYAEEHREYVAYEDLPPAWIDAITASEDQRYFDHPGVDLFGISRAMWQNVEAGRVVAGGSTLTQQTAKNLYYRPDRSLKSKWQELKDALRLEAHFSKEQILEFYANQFHVSSNGRGIGIAARYFFDKEVHELDVVECAFIAGMVKSPSTYNPFIGRTWEIRNGAMQKAQGRTRYVLDRMLSSGSLTTEEHAQLVEQEIPFRRGTFQYSSNVLVDEVSRRLDQAPFPQLFESLGIDNISTAGIQVTTTIDQVAQREATYALWHHLSEVGPLLEGQGVESLRLADDLAPAEDPFDLPFTHDFRRARVQASDGDGLQLDLGSFECRVDREGLQRMAEVLVRAEAGEKWKKAFEEDVNRLVEALKPGTVLWVSIQHWDEEGQQGLCDLEIRPELQGSVVLLEEGRIRAMVGGNDNQNFNRALASRQLGSTWKPLVYLAAIEAGWSPADRLDNRKNVFYFENSWYYPRADHRGEDFVSMSWAGTRSENLGSIWLLYHLPDRMDSDQFKREAIRLGLAPDTGLVPDREWREHIRDDLGVISTDAWLPELAFNAARLAHRGRAEVDWAEQIEVQSLMYGWFAGRFEKERAQAEASTTSRTGSRKLWALDSSFLRFKEAGEDCTELVASLASEIPDLEDEEDQLRITPVVGPGGMVLPVLPAEPPDPSLFEGLYYQQDEAQGARVACGGAGATWKPVDLGFMDDLVNGRLSLPLLDREGPDSKELDFWIDGRIRRSTLHWLETQARPIEILLAGRSAYDLERLQYHPDFRTQFALHYVADKARQLGVAKQIPLFLSMPLGAADISLVEMVGVYEGIAGAARTGFDGKAWDSEGNRIPVQEGLEHQILISEIRDRNGQVLYRAEREGGEVDPVEANASRLTGDILRNVVRWGTGRRAVDAVTLGDARVPVAGKTGTTNDFKNAAFLGYVPRVSAGQWMWADGYALGVYVGYDDNREMVRGGVKLAGSSGALPAWIGTAQGLADAGLLGDSSPIHTEITVHSAEELTRIEAEDKSGLPRLEEWNEDRGLELLLQTQTRSILVDSSDPVLDDAEKSQWADDWFDDEPTRIEAGQGTPILEASP